MANRLDFAASLLGTFLAQGRGVMASEATKLPENLLELYDIENCPYCRIVREVITQLDLDVLIYPCPKGGKRFRDKAIALGGKAQFPFLVDSNQNVMLYESADIIAHLIENYSAERVPSVVAIKVVRTPAAMAISGLRALSGGLKAKPSIAPEQPLELYSFESSPYARLVRERLCEAEIPYIVRSAGRTGWQDHLPPPLRERIVKEYEPTTRNRRALLERAGRVSIPYLVDPNTGVEMAESAKIVAYIDETYCDPAIEKDESGRAA